MILTTTREKYGGTHRLVLYDTDAEGRCAPQLTKSLFDDDIDTWYIQRDEDVRTLKARVFQEEISPLGFFVELTRIGIKDVAARTRLSQRTVRAHLTPEGFRRARVDELARYARVFDVSVADFFAFTFLDGELSAEVATSRTGIVQEVRVSPRP